MTFEWVVPAAELALENHEQVLSTWQKIDSRLRGKKSRIVITGMAGVGKTVLFDHITGRAYRRNYQPPGQSQQAEDGMHAAKRKRLVLSVIPGQESHPRMQALAATFGEKQAVDGVVHVVANGFVDVRDDDARRVLREDATLKTVQRFRNYQKLRELDDLSATCEVIRTAFQHHRRPKWLLVAVSKIDLFHDELAEVKAYYSPTANSPFAERLRRLQSQLGTDNFRWEVVPVCSWLENFSWADQVRHSRLQQTQRDFLLARFLRHVESYCEDQ